MGNIINPSKEDIFEEDISSGNGISQELLRKIAASINSINHDYRVPIGSIQDSILPESNYQDLASNAWVLYDNREITNSDLGQYIINNSLNDYIDENAKVFLSDHRGLYRVTLNAGRSDSRKFLVDLKGGEFHEGQLKAHSHSVSKDIYGNDEFGNKGLTYSNGVGGTVQLTETFDVSTVGHAQNTVNSIGVYTYIKIWNQAQV